ncbi:MAG: DUF3530 family protein [Bacteroidota bacterium]
MILFLSAPISIFASNLEKEKRWAAQVVDSIIDGETVWLNDGKSNFLGIYTDAEEDKNRALIVMHGTGVHPNWQQVVQPLRVGLTEHNWNTLSIQMPVLSNDAKHEEYAPLYSEVIPRINAAVADLKSRGNKKIFLIGHSQGATMSAYYLTTSKQDINGFVAIGMSSFGTDLRQSGVNSLKSISIPVLDLYALEDLDTVLNTTEARAQAARESDNKNFTQKQITGNHFFDDENETLIKTVAEWLEKQ